MVMYSALKLKSRLFKAFFFWETKTEKNENVYER